jgi:hypothetical protein
MTDREAALAAMLRECADRDHHAMRASAQLAHLRQYPAHPLLI